MLETVVTLLIVAAAGGYLVWSIVRAARGQTEGCGTGCGCGPHRQSKSANQRAGQEPVELNISAPSAHHKS